MIAEKASDIKVAAIGYGGAFNMGRRHLSEAKEAGMTPVAVADMDPKRLRIAEVDFPGIQTYSSVGDLLKGSDAQLVVVVTPHNTHAPIARQCLNAGRHVVVEKPLAITTAECDAMIRAAENNGVVLSAFHNRHWDGCILRALQKIRGGAIGDVVRIEAHMGSWHQPGNWWRSSRSVAGGVLYDWGVHLLEYALQIIDANIVEVSGFSFDGYWADKVAWKEDTVEDEATAFVRFDNRIPLALRVSSIDTNPREGMLEVFGTKGAYIFDGKNYTQITARSASRLRETGENPDSEWNRYYQNIANHLAEGEELVITPEWSRRPIHILDLAVKSAQQGKTLKAKYP